MSNTNTIAVKVKKIGEGGNLLAKIQINQNAKFSELISEIKKYNPKLFQDTDKLIFNAVQINKPENLNKTLSEIGITDNASIFIDLTKKLNQNPIQSVQPQSTQVDEMINVVLKDNSNKRTNITIENNKTVNDLIQFICKKYNLASTTQFTYNAQKLDNNSNQKLSDFFNRSTNPTIMVSGTLQAVNQAQQQAYVNTRKNNENIKYDLEAYYSTQPSEIIPTPIIPVLEIPINYTTQWLTKNVPIVKNIGNRIGQGTINSVVVHQNHLPNNINRMVPMKRTVVVNKSVMLPPVPAPQQYVPVQVQSAPIISPQPQIQMGQLTNQQPQPAVNNAPIKPYTCIPIQDAPPHHRYAMFDGYGYLYSPQPIHTEPCVGGLKMCTDAKAEYTLNKYFN